MVDSSKPKIKSHHSGNRRKKTVIEHENVNQDPEKITQNSAELDAVEKKDEQSVQTQRMPYVTWFSLLISGILGGLIALGLLIGLQWAGVLSASLVKNHTGAEKVLQIAEKAKSQGDETREQLRHALQEIDDLKTKFSSFSAQRIETIHSDEVSQRENEKAFTVLEEKVKSLEGAAQTFLEISKDMETALSVGQSNADTLAVLKQQLAAMQEEVSTKMSSKKEMNTALFAAITSLKNAVERGGSYSDELKLLEKLAPSIDGLDLLQKTATIGLPNSAQLAVDFSYVADAIVATQSHVAPDAPFFKRVLAWMKGLIVSRPIGNVEGMTLGAIAARMEVAIQAGDYEKALSEWQTLPQNAKAVSADFIHKLETRIAIHQFFQKLLVSVQQGSFKTTKM